jgi:hypothetical protein
MNIDPKNPFNWRMRTEPSIFAKDPAFRPKGPEGKTGGQIMSEHVEKMRSKGESPGTIHALGGRSTNKEREKELLAYKQFGTYAKAKPSKKPNKHESGKKK